MLHSAHKILLAMWQLKSIEINEFLNPETISGFKNGHFATASNLKKWFK